MRAMFQKVLCFYQSAKIAEQLASFFPPQHWSSRTLSTTQTLSVTKQPDLYIIEHDNAEIISKVLEELEKQLSVTKLCIITSEKTLGTRLSWLEFGADECILKPYSLGECKLRLHRLLRYQKVGHIPTLYAGDLGFQPHQGTIFWQGAKKQLRNKESKILAHFFRYKNRVVSRDQLIDAVWPEEDELPTYSTIDVYIRRLRISLGHPGKQLQTVRGFGYVLRDG